MPIYEYHCDGCDRNFEMMRGINDPPLESCEECGGAVRKLISAPAFQFKGSGWYVTDYARKGEKEAKGGSESSSSEASSSKKTESSSSSDSTSKTETKTKSSEKSSSASTT